VTGRRKTRGNAALLFTAMVALPVMSALVLACGPAPTPVAPQDRPSNTPVVPADPFAAGPAKAFRSERFHFGLQLPDGAGWRVDDHSRPFLLAIHGQTQTQLSAEIATQPELVNRARCRDKAQELGYWPKVPLTTVDEAVLTEPTGWDTLAVVAFENTKGASAKSASTPPTGPLVGHVLLVAAQVRRCLFVHARTQVASEADEPVLSSRLASLRVKLIAGLSPDVARTDGAVTLPKDRP